MTATFSQTVRLGTGGEDVAGDTLAELDVRDRFIPRVQASVHLVPHDNLDITFGVRVEDTIRAKGDIEATPSGALGDAVGTLSGKARFTVPRPMWVNMGIRYAQRIAPRPEDPSAVSKLSGRVEDHMANEKWDIEVNAVYERNRAVDAIVTDVRDLGNENLDPISPNISLPHLWDDQWSIRAGGDWNVIPGVMSFRLGASFETNGLKKGAAPYDYFPLQRYGAHVGFTFRVKRLDISAAYAHFFLKDVTNSRADAINADGTARVPQTVSTLTGTALDSGTAQSVGTFGGRLNIASLSLNYHFK